MKKSLLLTLVLISCLLNFSAYAQPVQVTKTNPTKVYVHYMPWFSAPQNPGSGTTSFGNGATGTPNKWGQHWCQVNSNTKYPDNLISVVDYLGNTVTTRDICAHYHPLIGPYDEQDSAVLEYHTLLMKLSGIDGTLIDWYGTGGNGSSDAAALLVNSNALINKVAEAGLKFGLVMEDAAWSGMGGAQNNGNYAVTNYFPKPYYIKLGDMRGSGATNATSPLICVFGPQQFKTPGQWNTILSGNTGAFLPLMDQSSAIGADAAGEFAWPNPQAGNPGYFTNLSNYYAYDAPGKNVILGTAYAGFYDFYNPGGANQYPIIPRTTSGTTTLNATLGLCTTYANNLDGIQLATWNDFSEGTILEPTVEQGFQSLDTIQKFTGVSYTEADLKQVYRLFMLRKKYLTNTTKQTQLDQVFNYFNALQIPNAVTLMNIIDSISAPGPTASVTAVGAPSENGATGQFIFSATGLTSSTTVYYTVGGTATTAHYTPSPALVDSVILTPTALSDTITIAAINDTIVNPNETVIITLQSDTTYTIVSNNATLTIIDNEIPPCSGPVIVNTATAPIIDGAADVAWSKAPTNLIAQVINGPIQTGSTWQAMYDTTNLYVLIKVKDANVSNIGTQDYDHDGVEVYIAGNNNKSGSYNTATDHQYRFNWNTIDSITGYTNNKAGIIYAIPSTTGGYTLEAAIPWTTIGGTAPFNGKQIGFDIDINDQQNNTGPREATAAWNGTNSDDYTNPSGFGTATVTICTGDTIPAVPVVVSVNTAKGVSGTLFSYKILATNSPASYAAINLPNGLTVNTTTGVISGTPADYGVFNATVYATNAIGTGNETVTITIDSLPAITSAATATGKVGTTFNYAITASHAPTSYGATGLPAGVVINATTGIISGIPTTSGIYSSAITATNTAGITSKGLTISIDTAAAVSFAAISATRLNAQVNVQWTVNNEKLVAQYNLQSSIDSINFTTVSIVTQVGNASTANVSYSAPDPSPTGGYIFYRVEAISTDINGPALYSTIIKVDKINTAVSLVSINATRQNSGIVVEWIVDSENFVKQYEVQRSTDSINFVTINTVTQIGNTGQNNVSYGSTDATPAAGNNFYRIIAIIIDSNSAPDTSVIVKVAQIIAASIYPNPVSAGGNMYLHLSNATANSYDIRLLDYLGQPVPIIQTTIAVSAGDVVYPLPLSGALIPGYYFLELNSATTGKKMLKLVVE